jgi:hypothetical protein
MNGCYSRPSRHPPDADVAGLSVSGPAKITRATIAMHPIFQYAAITFASLFTAKMIWLLYLAVSNKVPTADDGEASGW